ncbi:hypothetical protein C8Q74DRAFT_1222777 [Fomes fomentarius]|nr:hypothetical protein C8Q74DRAFT_1222777 [Fomes fomentarius]
MKLSLCTLVFLFAAVAGAPLDDDDVDPDVKQLPYCMCVGPTSAARQSLTHTDQPNLSERHFYDNRTLRSINARQNYTADRNFDFPSPQCTTDRTYYEFPIIPGRGGKHQFRKAENPGTDRVVFTGDSNSRKKICGCTTHRDRSKPGQSNGFHKCT